MPGNNSNVVSLLHMNGANNGTVFPDDALGGAGHTWTASGITPPITDTSQNAFGAVGKSAGKFDGSTSYLTTPYSSDFDFGTADFTVDFWVKFNALPTSGDYTCFWATRANGDSTHYNSFYFKNVSNVYTVYFICDNVTLNASYNFVWSPSINTWYHIALVRNSTNFYIFINGTSQTLTVAIAISTNNINSGVNNPFIIGRIGSYDTFYLNGWIDEFRVSTGIARWTSNFTPLKQAYNGMLLDNGSAWKTSSLIQVNNGAAWKDIALIQINNGSAWKDLK